MPCPRLNSGAGALIIIENAIIENAPFVRRRAQGLFFIVAL
jgi:hypothetical protein